MPNPVMEYEALEAECEATGIMLRDLGDSLDHMDRWKALHGLPDHDDDGVHWRSSKTIFRRYQEAADGEAGRPTYANVWQHLLEIGEAVDWVESPGERSKTVALSDELLGMFAADGERRTASGLERVAAMRRDGAMDRDHLDHLERIVVEKAEAARICREALLPLIERHGRDLPGHGRVLAIRLRVET